MISTFVKRGYAALARRFGAGLGMRVEGKFVFGINVILPVQSPRKKYFA
jgi:hypothetical protein